MCGRAAQTHHAVRAAARDIIGDASGGGGSEEVEATASSSNHRKSQSQVRPTQEHGTDSESSSTEQSDNNYNMSPGMDAVVFWKDESQTIRMERKRWGLLTKPGTAKSPLPENTMNLHFKNLMFNARSDTLFEKPTFARLANSRRSCLIALDGFFEWKTELGKKQPYFVYRNKKQQDPRPYLLFAGLWTSISTGRIKTPTLDTFTILTTEACPALEWLHTRMPVSIWDMQLAHKWLDEPSSSTLAQIDAAARSSTADQLQWHAVSPQMSSMKFRTADAIKAVKKTKSVKAFFQKASSSPPARRKDTLALSETTSTTPITVESAGKKRTANPSSSEAKTDSSTSKTMSGNKKPKPSPPSKRGPMDAFFKPKKKCEK